MLKKLLVLVAVGVLGALSIGAAAQLQIDGLTEQAGVLDDLTCDDNGVSAAVLGVELDGPSVDYLQISDIDGDCAGKTVGYKIEGSGGSILAQGDATIVSPTTTIDYGPGDGDNGGNNPEFIDVEDIEVIRILFIG